MTEAHQRIYNLYNLILAATQTHKTMLEIQQSGIPLIRNTLYYKCKHLHDMNLMTCKNERNPADGKLTLYCIALVPKYPLKKYLEFMESKSATRTKAQKAVHDPFYENNQIIYTHPYNQLMNERTIIPAQKGVVTSASNIHPPRSNHREHVFVATQNYGNFSD